MAVRIDHLAPDDPGGRHPEVITRRHGSDG